MKLQAGSEWLGDKARDHGPEILNSGTLLGVVGHCDIREHPHSIAI